MAAAAVLSKEQEKAVESAFANGAVSSSDPELKEPLAIMEKAVVEAIGGDHFMARDSEAIQRFLMARKLKLKPTVDMIREHTIWRSTTLPIHPTGPVLVELRKGKMELHGKSCKGLPLVIISSRLFDPKVRDLQASVQAAVYIFERALETMPDAKQFAVLYDRNGFSFMRNWDFDLLREVVKTLSANYPERLSDMYIYPAGGLVTLAIKMLGPFLDPRTRAKVHALNTTEQLLRHVPEQFVPVASGGTSTHVFDPAQFDGAAPAPASMVAPVAVG